MGLFTRTELPPMPRTAERRPTLAVRSPASMVASAKLLSNGSTNGESGYGGKRQEWQTRFWDAFDEVGEVHYAASFFGWCFSRVTLAAGVIDADGNVVPVFDDEGNAVEDIDQGLADEATELVQSLRSSVGGQPQLMFSFGVNLAGPGEVLLLGADEETPMGSERSYEALSTEELRRKSDRYVRRRGPTSADEEDLPSDVYVLRIWQHHPRYSQLADSSFRAVLEIIEELVLLTRSVRAIATSRLAGAGLLFVSNALDYPDDDTAGEGTEEADPFTRDLITAMTTPIRDRSSAASVVPMVVRADGKPDDLIRHWDFSRDMDGYPAVALRREAVDRFAQGIDLPVEVVTGHRQTTFANAAAIDESLHKAHVEPKLEILVDGLTVGFLRPALLDATAPDALTRKAQIARLVVLADASELIAKPDMGEAANNTHDRWAISDATLRRSHGFSEGDAPDDEEIARRIAIRTASSTNTPESGAPPAPPEEPPPPPVPEEPPPPSDPNAPPEDAASLVDRVHAAVDIAVERAVEHAGAKLFARTNGKTGLRERLASVPKALIPATLGPKAVASLIPRDLFDGDFDALGRKVEEWAEAIGHEDPSGLTTNVVALAGEAAERRLYSSAAGVSREMIAEAVW